MIVSLICYGCHYKAKVDFSAGMRARYIFVPHSECPLHGVGAILGHLENPDAAWTDLGGEAG